MIVYILTRSEYEGPTDILGVYDSFDKASNAEVDESAETAGSWYEYFITQMEVE